MAFYSIGDVAERCGINPVTLRAWQRRYGLLKPQRSEGGHRQFDEEDIQRIEAIKRWIKNGVPVGKVKALLENQQVTTQQNLSPLQEEMMSLLRMANPGFLRDKVVALGSAYSADTLIDQVFVPIRHRLSLEQNTARTMCSLLDGVLIEYVAFQLFQAKSAPGKPALLIGWGGDDRTRLWLEAWRLSRQGWHIDVLAEPIESPRPELFPGQRLFVWTGKLLSRRQQEQLAHWRDQGYNIVSHGVETELSPLPAGEAKTLADQDK